MQNFLDSWFALGEKLGFERRKAEEIGLLLFQKHQETHRAYHNVRHIESLLADLEKYRNLTNEQEMLQLAIFFHDCVYDPRQSNNEKQSGIWAKKYLEELNFPKDRAEKINTYILATQGHLPSYDTDLQLFLDLDLAILGTEPKRYLEYSEQIRKEYAHIPAFFYKMGRKKVIKSFLGREKIFHHLPKTLETQARINLKNELVMLA